MFCAGRTAREDGHVVPVDGGVLHHDHRVGAIRHRRTGRDLDAGAGLDGARGYVPGEDAAGQAQPHRLLARGPSGVCGHHRVAVHAGPIEGRNVDGGDHVGGQDPASGLEQRHLLPALDRPDALLDDGQGLGD